MLLYLHWQSVFCFVGLLAIAWGFLVRWYAWKQRTKTTPVLHSEREEGAEIKSTKGEREEVVRRGSHFPWRKLVTEKPFWWVPGSFCYGRLSARNELM